MTTLPAFVGDQTPKFFDENSAVYFTYRYWHSAKKTAMTVAKVLLKVAKKYKNIEDILSDISLIPLEERSYTIDELKRHISVDALVPFPEFYPEYSILAYTSKSDIDKPIVFVNHPDGAFYVAHPEIEKYIRRVPVSTEAEGTV